MFPKQQKIKTRERDSRGEKSRLQKRSVRITLFSTENDAKYTQFTSTPPTASTPLEPKQVRLFWIAACTIKPYTRVFASSQGLAATT
jgi:hypothetical protein